MSHNTEDQVIMRHLLCYVPLGIFKWRQLSLAWRQCLQSEDALNAAYQTGVKLDYSDDFEDTDELNLASAVEECKWIGLVHGLSLQARSGNLRQMQLEFDADNGDLLICEVAKLLPANLTVLALSFRVNDFISDIGLCCFAESLPQSLTKLCLNVRNSDRCDSKPIKRSVGERSHLTITDVGVEVLSKCLPSHLKCLQLELFSCNITEVGAGHIAQRLPQGLQELNLGFDDQGLPRPGGDFDRIGSLGAREIAKHLPAVLRKLRLFFWGCEIEDEGILGLAAQLPQLLCLTSLEINLAYNNGLGAVALRALTMSLPRNVTSLTLSLPQWIDMWNNPIDENAMRGLVEPLRSLPCLNSLSLLFSIMERNYDEKFFGVGAVERMEGYGAIVRGSAIPEPVGIVKSLLQEVPQRFQEQVWIQCSCDDEDDDEDDIDENDI